MNGSIPYNEDEKHFVVSNYHKMSNETLSKGLLKMGYFRTPKSVQQYLTTRGFSRTRQEINKFLKEKYKHKYPSKKEIDFIKQNYKHLGNKEMSVALKEMGFNISPYSVKRCLNKLSIKRTRQDLENIGAVVMYSQEEVNFIYENYQTLPKFLIVEKLQTMGFDRTKQALKLFYRKHNLVITEQQRKEIIKLGREIKKSRLLDFYQQT